MCQTTDTPTSPQAVANLEGQSGLVKCRAEDKGAVESAISAAGVDMKLTVDDEPLVVDKTVSNIKPEW